MPNKFKTWYECCQQKEGTLHENETKCNQTHEEETNLNRLIEKYGITALAQKTKPDEEYYIDTRMYGEMTVQDTLKLRNEIKDYYEKLPSKIRKTFGDNYENFYQKMKNGEFEQFIENGILSNETVQNVKDYLNEEKQAYKNRIINEYRLQQEAIKEAKEGENTNEN